MIPEKMEQRFQEMLNDIYDPEFYQRLKTTKISDEPMDSSEKYGCPESVMIECHDRCLKGGKHAIKVCLAAMERYPDFPTLKNFLIIAYQKNNKQAESQQVLKMCREKHPDYLFGKIAEVSISTEDDLPTRYKRVFGDVFNIEDAVPTSTVFHTTEVIAFNMLTLTFFSETNDLPRSAALIKFFDTIAPDKDIDVYRSKFLVSQIQEELSNTKEDSQYPERDYGAPPEAPEKLRFSEHPNLEKYESIFYEHDIQQLTSWEKTQEILRIPRAELVQELTQLLLDEIFNAPTSYEYQYAEYSEEYEELASAGEEDTSFTFEDYCQEDDCHYWVFEAALELLYLLKDTSAIDVIESLLLLHPKLATAMNYDIINGDFLVHYIATDIPRFANLFIHGKIPPPSAGILAKGFEALLYSRRDLRQDVLAAIESILLAWVNTPEDSPLLDRRVITLAGVTWQNKLAISHKELHLQLFEKKYFLRSMCHSPQLIHNAFHFSDSEELQYFKPSVFELESPHSPAPYMGKSHKIGIYPNLLEELTKDTADNTKNEPPKLIFRLKNPNT